MVRFLAISALLHLAVISVLWVRISSISGPLGGGGGGSGVVVVEIQSPNPGQTDQIGQKSRTFRMSPQLSGPAGPGIGEGQGIGSGQQGNDPVLAQIVGRIERVKRYPLLARKSGIEGRSLVRFKIGEGGKAEEIFLKSSSGSGLLDNEALETIRRAAPFPTYPDPLEVWIRFKMGLTL